MKLIGTEAGRAALQFPAEEIRPLRGLALQSAMQALVKRYGFLGSPNKPWAELENSPWEFSEGTVESKGETIPIHKFIVYTDALAVDCKITDDAELALADIMQWMRDALGFRDFQRPPKQIFATALIVEFEKPIEKFFHQWGRMHEILSAPIRELYDVKFPIHLFRIVWGCDPQQLHKANIFSDFQIERRLGELYSAGRFHCTGPVKTKQMIATLEAIEALIPN